MKQPTSELGSSDLITLGQAAAIAGRSYAWARDKAATGQLQVERLRRRVLVSKASLARLLEAEAHCGDSCTRYPPYLRLVVDNSDRWILRGRRPKCEKPTLAASRAGADQDLAA